MLEILKSKIMVVFIIMVLGICYFDSNNSAKLEEKSVEAKEALALNIK